MTLIKFSISILLVIIITALVLFYNRIHGTTVLSYPNESSNTFLKANALGEISDDWSISGKQIKLIKSKLNKTLKTKKILIPSYKLQLLKYKKDGVNKIYLNGFCFLIYDQVSSYWESKLVVVNDGGSCFFSGSYDVTSQKLIEFEINQK